MQNACIAEATKLGAFADEFRTKSNTGYRREGIKFSPRAASVRSPSPERSRGSEPCPRARGGRNQQNLGLLVVPAEPAEP